MEIEKAVDILKLLTQLFKYLLIKLNINLSEHIKKAKCKEFDHSCQMVPTKSVL